MNSSDRKVDERPEDFEARWASFVSFFNVVRAHNPVITGGFEREVHDTFFELLNAPGIKERELSLQLGVQVLKRAAASVNYPPLTAKDAGFVMFCFIAFGAVWVAPFTTSDEKVPPELLQ